MTAAKSASRPALGLTAIDLVKWSMARWAKSERVPGNMTFNRSS
jgi:hypothetical protein